jgi:type I restriction enzyme S subunit
MAASNVMLGDVCLLIVDSEHKTAPSQDTGYPNIRTPNIGRGRLILDDDVRRVSEEVYEEWTRRAVPEPGDLILAREAPVGNVAIVPDNPKVCLGQRTVLLRPDREQVDPQYLDYLLLGDELQGRMAALSSGATVPHLNMSDIRSLRLPPLPSLPTQRKIAAILSAYDDLIENNTRRIAILEEMAQLIYREWFVHFRFPGHEDVQMVDSELGAVPEGWGVCNMETLLQYHIGVSWGNDVPDVDFVVPAYVIRRTDIPAVRHLRIDECPFRFLKQSYYDSRVLHPGDVIFEVSGGSKDQPVGRPLLVNQSLLDSFDERLICASFCKLLRVDAQVLYPELFYLHLLEIYENGEIEQYQVQSTGIKNLKFSHFLEEARLPVPDRDLQFKFVDWVRPVFKMVANLGQKNEILRRTRDLILPRLISGELDVSEIETVFS